MSIPITLNRVSAVPLYHQLADQLKQAVFDGELPKGAMLDSELVLAENWKVSRPTVRRAIQQLVDDGMLVRKRGVGTQVVNEEVRRGFDLTSLHDDLVQSGRRPSTEVLVYETVPAHERVSDALEIPLGAPVAHLVRIRSSGGDPLAYMTNWFRAELVDHLSRSDLEQDGFYHCLRAIGVRPHTATQRVCAAVANPLVASHLGVRPGAALVTMSRVMQDDAGVPIEFGEHLYDAERYSVEVTLVAT